MIVSGSRVGLSLEQFGLHGETLIKYVRSRGYCGANQTGTCSFGRHFRLYVQSVLKLVVCSVHKKHSISRAN